MWNTSRGLGATVIRALAKVGLVWALAVLGALFMAMSSQGQEGDGAYALSSATTHAAHDTSLPASSGNDPRTLGLALALVVLAGGATVLIAGASRGDRQAQLSYAVDPDPELDLPLALGLSVWA
jgi:hypothetical protein